MKVAFDIMPYGEHVLNNYNQIHCNMIFDVKMEDFIFKARLVADGHMIKTPRCQTYFSLVSRETVRLAPTIYTLNDIQVKESNVMNA